MILNEKGEVLLGQRNVNEVKAGSALNGAGKWSMPGGKVHFSETLEEAAAREVMEEAGIEIQFENLKVISLAQDILETAHFITIGLLTENCLAAPIAQEEAIASWQWFPLDQLPSPLYLPTEKIIANYQAGRIYNQK